ncbi:MAG: N-acyl amino acid synthase FeeM domain-containing protein [bacterium]
MKKYQSMTIKKLNCAAPYDFENIFIRQVGSKEELIQAFQVRWKGYAKYFHSKREMIDKYDLAPNMTILLAQDEHHNPVGTLRILDRGYGSIELDEYIDVDSLLPQNDKRCAEATRFSIPVHPQAMLIKLFLWKSFLIYCLKNKINTILISGRPAIRRVYKNLLSFDDVGPPGVYYHSLLGNLEHHCFIWNMEKNRPLLRAHNPSLYDFLFIQYHPSIHKNCYHSFQPGNFILRIRVPYKETIWAHR